MTMAHPDRVEIARYLLSRGLDSQTLEPAAQRFTAAAAAAALAFPAGLAPVQDAVDPLPGPEDPLPEADAIVITWTVDELAGLCRVYCPGQSPTQWIKYARHFATKYQPNMRSTSPAARSKRLGSYWPFTIGGVKVLLVKSELHLNQDGKSLGNGTATLPVKDFFAQIIDEVKPSHILTTGTAGSVFDDFGLGDVVVTRAAKFRLQNEFAKEPFNGHSYASDWSMPLDYFPAAEQLMGTFAPQLLVPPFAPPTDKYVLPGGPISAPAHTPSIKAEQGSRDMPEFHPILTTDYFEYGTTTNRLDQQGAAVEMGDAVLGMVCSQLADPPKWAVVRNMSDPVIDGTLSAKEFHLNQQTTWAVGFYTAYGEWTSVMSALTTWAIIAGISQHAQ
jgi:nucleoside phosphorylase